MLGSMWKNGKGGKMWTVCHSFYLPSSSNKIYMILNNVYLNHKINTKYQKLKSNICLHQLLQHSLKTTAHFNYTHIIWTKLQLLVFMHQNPLGKGRLPME